jgi:hypothetical protein
MAAAGVEGPMLDMLPVLCPIRLDMPNIPRIAACPPRPAPAPATPMAPCIHESLISEDAAAAAAAAAAVLPGM